MADVVTSGFLNSLIDRLAGRMVEKFGWLTDVGGELKKLEGTLSTIRDVLEDAEARQVQEKALRGWLRRLKDVAYDIDDLLDEDFTCRNRKRSLTPESSTSWMKGKVSNLLSLPNSVMSQNKISTEIREIRERLDELAEERSKFHLREKSAVTCGGQEDGVREETGSFVIESEVFGREEDKKKIIKFLVDASGDKLGVIAIVGMGGLGKTTLVQLVYNDQKISSHFEKKIWVCVSDDFNPKRLVGLIIEQTTESSPCNLTSMASMESKLKQELEKKRFLLMLDDVWNKNDQKWERLRSLLTIGAAGSKVLVTTRDGRIASMMATVETHFLKALSEDNCWLLFEKRAFGIGACEKTTNLVTIGKEIVKKCGGVPLAAKVLGSLMRSKEGESEWLAVRDNDIWKSEENDILPALRLSYNHLPSYLKQCFSYCSMFPKDTLIEDATLVELWIAEGFIRRPNKNVNLEDVGYQYLRELLSRSLFERPVDEWMSSIKIHDLVHDLAQSTSDQECSSINIACNERAIYPTTRYSSFICTKETIPSILEILNEAKKLRTIYFLNSHTRVRIKEEDMIRKILETVFSSTKLLRALYFTLCSIKQLPISISNLRHLRYLNLSFTGLETLPQSIGFLQNLHFLNLQGCRSLKELPDSIGNLSNLLILNLEYCTSLVSLPTSIGNLSDLLTLKLYFCQSFVSLPTSIGHLKSLQTLELAYTNIEKLPESLCCLSNLRSINLQSCKSLLELPENMKDMKSLTNLDINLCYKLTGMPSGIGQLSHLRELPLFVVSEKSDCGLGELNGLNLLERHLHIRNLENVKNFQQARDANLIEKHGLESLELSWGLDTYKRQVEACVHTDQDGQSRQDLIRALAIAEKVLEGFQPHENLTGLRINGYLGKIFPEWLESSSSLPNLVSLGLSSCFRCETLLEISQWHNLESLYLGKLPAVKSIPPLGHLPYLKRLSLEYLLSVKSIPPLGHLPNLKRLSLKYLLSVKCLGSEFYGTGDDAFPALETLSLEYMPELEEWCEASKAGQRSFPRLNYLSLRNSPKLKVLPSSLPSLEELYLGADYELLLSSIPSGAFPNLKNVYLPNFDASISSVPQIVAERLTFQSCLCGFSSKPMDADELNFMRSVAGLR